MTARCLMVQGTASHVGKTVLVAGLLRLFARRGLRVAPFKAQNMALNAYVTPEGDEIAMAQAVQARAAGIPPHVDMNPILLKPKGEHLAQVVLRGRAVRDMAAGAYWEEGFEEAWAEVTAALDRLRDRFDLVVLEGAGGPAEVNLRHRDLANMRLAAYAEAPVVLVGDIERGGVFAQLLGTLALLPGDERRRVAALVVNKFRGDLALFDEGRRFLEAASGTPLLGVVPYLPDLDLPAEDSLALAEASGSAAACRIAVIRHPHIANFTDLDPLARERGVRLVFATRPEEVADADAVVVPGTKNSVADLKALRSRGLDRAILAARARGATVVGLCGGLQMLGAELRDEEGLEDATPGVWPGVGLLPVVTEYRREKATYQVEGRVAAPGPFAEAPIRGYELHSGVSRRFAATPFALLHRRGGEATVEDGVYVDAGLFGTYVHGLFDEPAFRRAFLASLGRAATPPAPSPPDPFDRLADHLATALDLRLLDALAGIRP